MRFLLFPAMHLRYLSFRGTLFLKGSHKQRESIPCEPTDNMNIDYGSISNMLTFPGYNSLKYVFIWYFSGIWPVRIRVNFSFPMAQKALLPMSRLIRMKASSSQLGWGCCWSNNSSKTDRLRRICSQRDIFSHYLFPQSEIGWNRDSLWQKEVLFKNVIYNQLFVHIYSIYPQMTYERRINEFHPWIW